MVNNMEVNKVAAMVADMEVHMVTDMEVDKVADISSYTNLPRNFSVCSVFLSSTSIPRIRRTSSTPPETSAVSTFALQIVCTAAAALLTTLSSWEMMSG